MDFSTEIGASARRPDLGRTVVGDFKTHFTVRADRTDTVTSLGDWAAAHGLRLTHTVLDRGRTPCRPILTLYGRGTLGRQRSDAGQCAERLARAGFAVVRTKIEAAPWNDGVPGTDAEAAAFPAHCHFEHHITLRLRIPYDTQRLAAVAERHLAHVSRNARQALSGGVQERSVTQRARRVGRPAARARLDALLDALVPAGFQPVDVDEEFVLHDDNPALDSGWAEESVERSDG
ncbi:hypothetical protein [Streptomyces sp. AK02-01A]|uniref:hypothetical protein n=1 Tax=Streptomyces sp. AK02-01A TaxID=3028648 RepID=UPI0029ADE5E2|nr:hypothetical protein [Streptomyces sp. AK02-01A]MDX3852061.1 hypothetical protein [Streptomyces sp. AK02-01A]